MKLTTIFILADRLPNLIQYFCPICGRENHDNVPHVLVNLPCRGCGSLLDGTEAAVEVLSNQKNTPAPSSA